MKKQIIAGHIGRFRKGIAELVGWDIPTREIKVCEYSERCKKECSADKDCQIKKFYDRYPEYQELNIGSRL